MLRFFLAVEGQFGEMINLSRLRDRTRISESGIETKGDQQTMFGIMANRKSIFIEDDIV